MRGDDVGLKVLSWQQAVKRNISWLVGRDRMISVLSSRSSGGFRSLWQGGKRQVQPFIRRVSQPSPPLRALHPRRFLISASSLRVFGGFCSGRPFSAL